jgi:tRNA threonylcarbamoyladenosine biosynthesis protein TsaB
MKLLALDAATTACSVACWSAGAVTARREEIAGGRQAEILMPMVKSAMREAGFEFRMLDGIAVTNGPGSFTGVRIGLAAARGLALAAGLPLAGVTTLQALAAAPAADERRGRLILAALDARRDQLYGQFFDAHGEPAGEPFAAAAATITERLAGIRRDIPPLLLVGSGGEAAARALDEAGHDYRLSASPPYPRADIIAALTARRGFDNPVGVPVAPLYLRQPGIGPSVQERAGA